MIPELIEAFIVGLGIGVAACAASMSIAAERKRRSELAEDRADAERERLRKLEREVHNFISLHNCANVFDRLTMLEQKRK